MELKTGRLDGGGRFSNVRINFLRDVRSGSLRGHLLCLLAGVIK